PYAAAAADHQTANARGLVEAGGAIRIPENRLDESSLAAQIATVLGDAQGAGMMAQAALSQGRPDAPQRLADLVEDLAGRRAE
ncbi:MAG TPA: UDP-N-acetylglucosamine--N-acetylmuramyl-(pentapeptide) pyrophosphoryl-undecaprenol N-acetylglucosamine transferase, partial [Roseovarius sp.]|nr:UDP-N-acetylglucosamine--N-acetylmuramyl-(pentapeptide) pyrophosphoryl-undecaprenol N-acetylglucosamine transferase [Roseovarius sp.]